MSKENNTRLYLVRHGRSFENDSDIAAGQSDTRLTPQGEEQARTLGKRLEAVVFEAAYASDLPRAMSTAELILDGREVPFSTTPLLRERHLGSAEGKTKSFYVTESLKRRLLFESLGEDEIPHFEAVEGMETDAQIIGRSLPFLQEKAQEHKDKNVLVVAHGNLIRTLLVHMGYGDRRELRSGTVKNTACIKMRPEGDIFTVEETSGVFKKEVTEEADRFIEFTRFHSKGI